VDAKALKETYVPSFFWFTRDGRAYLVSDTESLARVGKIHAPLLAGGRERSEETLGEQLRRLADELLRSGAAEPAEQGPTRRV
jgi:hypothetical protein